MALKQNFELMAKYNQWMNDRLYNSLVGLSAFQLSKDQGAFFGSILGTLNHILVGDIIWLKRFSKHPSNYTSLSYVTSLDNPSSLSQIIYSDICTLTNVREKVDEAIVSFSLEASEQDYEVDLTYKNTKGQSFKKPFGYLVHHFYNHQTHHRGQVTTLLNQLNIDVGATDLLVVIPESEMV